MPTFTEDELAEIYANNPDLAAKNGRLKQTRPAPAVSPDAPEAKRNKYGAIRTYSELCGRTFDSKAECRRGEELALLEKAGEITELQYQVKETLSDKPKISITIDFFYVENEKFIYEDVKGVLTCDFRTKLAWLKEKFGIDVKLIR